MIERLFSSKFLSPYQHFFLPHKSCLTQLLTVMDEWTEALNRDNSVDVLYLNFKKAFDFVPHEKQKKMLAYGFRGNLFITG